MELLRSRFATAHLATRRVARASGPRAAGWRTSVRASPCSARVSIRRLVQDLLQVPLAGHLVAVDLADEPRGGPELPVLAHDLAARPPPVILEPPAVVDLRRLPAAPPAKLRHFPRGVGSHS